MKTTISMVIVIIIMSLSSVVAQQVGASGSYQYVPRDSSKIVWNFGAGMGVPYGVFGAKISLGTRLITGDIGLGILPILWSPAISVSGVVYFRDQHAAIRPKITLAYSNIVSAAMILDQDSPNPWETVYDETYPGIGVYGGVDWRLGKTSPFCIDLNIGWVFPSVGNDEIRRGYIFTDELSALDTPKVSIGLVYAPQRSLRFILTHGN
jgi:hypothetical protein